MYKKILLAADGSKHSLRAADRAIALAKLTENSIVEVVNVVDSKTSKADALQQLDNFGVLEKRKERLKDTINKATEAGITYEIKFLRGEPAPTIIEYANENNFDVVVIGSRGLNGLQELMLGSVSHKVAKGANCPVMIVK
ncbi:universal stress protein [Desulfuribacillus stibiiarsenatis]|uniref:Universal stress protein n=1 Tax=Desulfuribacillus stibiiarsenatis TaxID=1390249 RepID=A0A1E5L9R5_9FIRM|nr:universal stress protein [Desulfuribacillus stibiiarsenatis]OEH86877.1 universal stress protein [Desulfuribacillus stibiiarsenatis]